jgi:hypothetical protein
MDILKGVRPLDYVLAAALLLCVPAAAIVYGTGLFRQSRTGRQVVPPVPAREHVHA